jgi:spermidine synthase
LDIALTPTLVLTAIVFVLIGIAVNYEGLRVYRPIPRNAPAAKVEGWIARWQFSPQSIGGFSYRQLALISVAGLFLELLMIRWISSEIRVFAFFKNFVLVACFLGFGLGCYLSRRPINLSVMLLSLIALALVCELPIHSLRSLVNGLPILVGAISEVNIWGIPSMPLNGHTLLLMIGALIFVIPLFGLIALVFVPIGQLVGWYLENASNGISGYTVNIIGSLVGIAIYTLLCFLSQSPAVWFLIAGVMMACIVWPLARLRWATMAAFLICMVLASIGDRAGGRVLWSPYQKLTLTEVRASGKIVAYDLITNGSWYQHIIDLSPGFTASHAWMFQKTPVQENAYNVPYRFYPHPASVLVLGAGTGNDVAAALRNGAGRVTAVEIDPLILKLGRELHFEQPYSSPRVNVVVDDARSYVENTGEHFDFIVFSLLDSHTTSSYYSNIRIDNYVYTVEALRATKRLLKPDGVMIIKFQVDTPWIAGRLHGVVQTVFGAPPIQFQAGETGEAVQGVEELYTTPGRFFIAGSPQRIEKAMTDPSLASYVAHNSNVPMEPAELTTDDWPYFYQHEPGLPGSVIIISAVLILLCWRFLRSTGIELGSLRWHFFFLGAGFLLLEAQIISKMALLFGTTWVVNSIVIAGLMVLIVGANLLVEWKRQIPIMVGYIGIFASMVVAYTIPLEKFFFASIWMKGLTATTVLCVPVFFAGIVFIRSFAREKFSGEALGSNLMGALVGGLLESFSMWTGIRSLLLLAALFYLASWIALTAQTSSGAVLAEAGSARSAVVG